MHACVQYKDFWPRSIELFPNAQITWSFWRLQHSRDICCEFTFLFFYLFQLRCTLFISGALRGTLIKWEIVSQSRFCGNGDLTLLPPKSRDIQTLFRLLRKFGSAASRNWMRYKHVSRFKVHYSIFFTEKFKLLTLTFLKKISSQNIKNAEQIISGGKAQGKVHFKYVLR